MKRVLVFMAVVMVLMASTASAEDWAVTTVPYDEGSNPGDSVVIRFTFDNQSLYLNHDQISGQYSDPVSTHYTTKTLFYAGDWAVVGSVVNGSLVADPYARFIRTDIPWGTGQLGYIGWAPNTPVGYVTTLLLGARYDGNNGVTIGTTPNASLYVEIYSGIAPPYPPTTSTGYSSKSYSFTTTFDGTGHILPVPEPSSIAGLLFGIAPLGVLIRKRRK